MQAGAKFRCFLFYHITSNLKLQTITSNDDALSVPFIVVFSFMPSEAKAKEEEVLGLRSEGKKSPRSIKYLFRIPEIQCEM